MQKRRFRELWGYPIDLVFLVGFWVVYSLAQDQPMTLPVLLPAIFPFWLGMTLAWLVADAGPRTMGLGPALTVWGGTLIGGLVLRNLGGQATAAPLIVVCTVVLSFALLGWRLIGFLVIRAKDHEPETHRTLD